MSWFAFTLLYGENEIFHLTVNKFHCLWSLPEILDKKRVILGCERSKCYINMVGHMIMNQW